MDNIVINIEEQNGAEQAPATAEPTTLVITDPLTDRYNTYGFIPWFKLDVVRNASVLVLGAGALGNEVLKNLALLGIGRILVVDFDTIEDSNLSRSVLFRAVDNGRKKAQVAAEAVRELNPDVAIQWLHLNINHALGLGVYRRMQAVIGCLDNREARLSINQACWRLNQPWIDGAIQELLGVERVFWPNRGACYECTLTDEDYRIISQRRSCNRLAHENIIEGKVPTTPTISSIIAAIQTQDALKLLHGMEVQSGKGLVFNGLLNDVYTVEYPEKDDCLSHEIWEEIVELPTATAQGTSLGELLSIARGQFDSNANLIIPAFVSRATCRVCGTERTLNLPLYQITFTEGHCEKCGELLSLATHEEINGQEDFLGLSLAQVGVPALDIIPARTADWRFKYFELTGDAQTFFTYEKGTPLTQR